MAVGGGAGSSKSAVCCAVLLASVLLLATTEAYDSLDPNGNITIKWDIMQWTPDGYVAVVTMFNYQQFRHIQAPGWQLGWTWAKKEVIWSMVGAQTTEQGDCSKFKGGVPHCCKRDPTIVDLLPGTPFNMQIANCCTYSQFLAQKTPTCCVSLSSFYNETIVSCPTCSCGLEKMLDAWKEALRDILCAYLASLK